MRSWKFFLVLAGVLGSALAWAEPARTVKFELDSRALAGNLVGVETKRAIQVRLPAGYDASGKRYPVVYYFHNMFSSPDRLFGEHKLAEIFERGTQRRMVGDVILVAGDFTTPNQFNFFGNTMV